MSKTAAAPASGAIDPKKGKMLVFSSNPWKRLVAFMCGETTRALVTIGGQTDAFFALNYIEELTDQLLGKLDISVVQALFGSWYSGFGESSLENDNEDLENLMCKLEQEGVQEVVLLGFSTGVQDIMNYLNSGQRAGMVSRVIFQGGMPDPTTKALDYEHEQMYRDEAAHLVRSGAGNQLVAPAAHPTSMSAFRYLAVGGRRTVRDFFDPDQTALDMNLVLGHINVPCLVIYCLTDAYSPTPSERSAIADKIQDAIPADVHVRWLEAACDENLNFLKGFEEEITSHIITFLTEEDRKMRERQADRQRGEAADEKRKRSVVFQSRGGIIKRSPSQVSVTSSHGRASCHG